MVGQKANFHQPCNVWASVIRSENQVGVTHERKLSRVQIGRGLIAQAVV
jgi:hypothetical protein